MRSQGFLTVFLLSLALAGTIQGYYTTDGQNIVDIKSSEVIQLKGIGLGGWLLPEGYMWGIRALDRPRQFETAIEELIGHRNAEKFWDLYHSNFVTREDVRIMKSWGVNTLRVPLLASMIQPREGQPDKPPFIYDERKFKYLDDFVAWCEELGMGVIWDLHGAPGSQNAENISDSDGEARLWTEKAKYWPLTIDLWDKITRRYADKECIVGYDLLNEPLLARYSDIDPLLLRDLYVLLTTEIRKTDPHGIIFIEGDDWAQDFSVLEPLDWDPHLVIAFHSYPPTHSPRGLKRWSDLREKYNIPLWHGETGEQNPPWELYERSTKFLEEANVGWNWWTHKKFELSRQPWFIPRTKGFEQILNYWNGSGPKPSKRQAKKWLFQQARLTNSKHCTFLPEMVESLHPLDPTEYAATITHEKPEITGAPTAETFVRGYPGVLRVEAVGYLLKYQWYRDDKPIQGATGFEVALHDLPETQASGNFKVRVWNEAGSMETTPVPIIWTAYEGLQVHRTHTPPVIDGESETIWAEVDLQPLAHSISGSVEGESDLRAGFRMLWDVDNLYLFIEVEDDSLSSYSAVDYLQDGVELYLDTDNSKSRFFGDDEFQLRFVLGRGELYVDIGAEFAGAIIGSQVHRKGYTLETSISWDDLHGQVTPGQFLGFDIHVNDSDSHTRNGKIAWFCRRDNAYQSPANFGTVRLTD